MENPPNSLNDVFDHLNRKADLVYRFVVMYNSYISEKHDYGTGELLTMAEAHTLSSINSNPGITITKLSELWGHTKGAISQLASRLEQKGFIERRQMHGNSKNIHLFSNEKGVEFCRQHMVYDSVEVASTMEQLLKEGCTMAEIDCFFKVMEKYVSILS